MAIFFKITDHFTAFPSIAFFYQCIWHLIVGDRDERLDPVRFAAVKNSVIKGKTFFIRFVFHTGWEDSGPVDRHPEAVKSHLCHKRDIFFVAVIEVNGFMRAPSH